MSSLISLLVHSNPSAIAPQLNLKSCAEEVVPATTFILEPSGLFNKIFSSPRLGHQHYFAIRNPVSLRQRFHFLQIFKVAYHVLEQGILKLLEETIAFQLFS